MLNLLDILLRGLFIASVPGITTDAQVGFQPPNDDWHTYVSNLGTQLALNVYLIDLREDRKLRMNDRVRTVQNGTVSETPASIKMDCHYLISAWSPASRPPESSRRSTSTTSSSRSSRRCRGSRASTHRGCIRRARRSSTRGPSHTATARCR